MVLPPGPTSAHCANLRFSEIQAIEDDECSCPDHMNAYVHTGRYNCMHAYLYIYVYDTYTYMQSAPKAYLCCGFIPCEENEKGGPNSFDMIAGGSNGNTLYVCMY